MREFFHSFSPSPLLGVGFFKRGGLRLTHLSSYPPKMLPGVDIMVCTSATNDKDARLLLSSMGVPFQGKHVN